MDPAEAAPPEESAFPRLPRRLLVIAAVTLLVAGAYAAYAWTPLSVRDDPLVRMPGTQPGEVALEAPNRCMNCHAGYNSAVEPGFNWQGSMMAQSARDPLFLAAMTVAAQDSIWAIDRPNATDLCLRCHFPKGWLEGRSDPTNASAMIGADFDGVQCDFCHRMWDPFFDATFAGTREDPTLGYWDETNASSTPSQEAANETYLADAQLAQLVEYLNGSPFFDGPAPASPDYDEATSGQYFVSPDSAKRASFADAEARHQMLYSRYHKSAYMCGTCHDVSNPVLANLGADPTLPLPSETASAGSYYHVERTFSEFMLSAYGAQGGAAGKGPFAPDVFETSLANDYVARCQDCHMRDEIGAGADKRGVPIRPNDSIEHPESGQPLHDLTGGNVWISTILASSVSGSPTYDATNAALLGQGPSVLTLDMSQGMGLDAAALLAGADRAAQQLLLAAAVTNVEYEPTTGSLTFRIENQTGHRLISGFPEGRRMFVNIVARNAAGEVVYQVNPYDHDAGTLRGLSYPYVAGHGVPSPAPLGVAEAYVDELVYEMHPSSTLTGEMETFHFVLADGRYKDNRIPPQGFRIDEAAARESVPVWHGVEDPAYFSTAEYAGGHDDVSLTIAAGAATVEIKLYYQTTSREYVEFLRDEINGTGNLTLPAAAYVAQTDPYFSQLRAWGTTIWDLWRHNMNRPGGAPFLMAEATFGATPPAPPPVPTLLSAAPGHQEVTLAWTDEHSSDPTVTGYSVYYDQSGKAQHVTTLPETTQYVDTGLTDGQEHCYKVTAWQGTTESAYSNILCAIPNNHGHTEVQVTLVETGRYETIGKGKDKTTLFVPTALFARGDGVVIRTHVADAATGLPVANAVVDLALSGPEPQDLVTTGTDSAGMAEVVWTTEAPNKRGQGGTTPGSYTVTVTGVTAAGYTWDGSSPTVGFLLE